MPSTFSSSFSHFVFSAVLFYFHEGLQIAVFQRNTWSISSVEFQVLTITFMPSNLSIRISHCRHTRSSITQFSIYRCSHNQMRLRSSTMIPKTVISNGSQRGTWWGFYGLSEDTKSVSVDHLSSAWVYGQTNIAKRSCIVVHTAAVVSAVHM